MKKILFLTVVFSLFLVYQTQAQLRFGIKAGVNIADVSLNDKTFSTDNMTGFQIGPTLEWLMIKNFGLETGVLYSQRGIKIQDASIDKNVGYLDIPVNLKLVLGLSEKIKPYAFAGPYISFNLSGEDISDQWQAESFSAGINLGAGIELFKHVQIGANYGIGLTDDYKSSSLQDIGSLSGKARTWSVTAAVYF